VTPKRYLASASAALMIQGGVFVSLLSKVEVSQASGQVTPAVNLALMQTRLVSVAKPLPVPQAAPQSVPEPRVEPAPQQKPQPKPQPIAKPVAEAKPKPKVQPAPKPAPALNPPPAVAESVPKPEAKSEAEQSVEQPAEPQAAALGSRQLPQLVEKPSFRKPPQPPSYPKVARKRGHQGVALIEVWLDEEGEQLKRSLLSSSGYRSLDNAALAAVSNWAFAPQTIAGRGLSSRVHIPVRFALR